MWNLWVFNFLSTWRRQWQPTPLLLPGKSHGWRSWWAAVHGVTKSRTRLSNYTFTFYFHALEKEMATHSSVLAWRIPGTGEPVGLPFMGSHRVEHDWRDLAAAWLTFENKVWKIIIALKFESFTLVFAILCIILFQNFSVRSLYI